MLRPGGAASAGAPERRLLIGQGFGLGRLSLRQKGFTQDQRAVTFEVDNVVLSRYTFNPGESVLSRSITVK